MKKQSLLVKNMILNAIYRGVYILFPMVTIPYLSRVLFANGIGKVNFSISIVNYFLIFASLGIPQYGIREIAKTKTSIVYLSKTFWEIFSINFISTILCIILYYFMILYVPYFDDKKTLFEIMGIMLILNIINLDWFFQGLEQYGYIAVRSIAIKIISLILMFIFVKKPGDYINYAIIYVVALSSNNILNVVRLGQYVKLPVRRLNISKHFKSILILVSTQLAINIYINLDTTMLGIFSSDTAVGIYTNASKLSKLITTVITSICVVLLPRMSLYLKENDIIKINRIVNKMLELLLMVSIPITIGMFILSKDIVFILFGPSFFAAEVTMKILSWLVIILSVGNLFGSQVLMTFGQEKKLLFSVLLGALINFTLNIFLIPRFSENGAATASLIAEIIVMIIQVYMALQYVNIHINIRRFSDIILSNISIVFILIILRLSIPSGLTRLMISILCSAASYMIINIVLKNPLLKVVSSTLKR